MCDDKEGNGSLLLALRGPEVVTRDVKLISDPNLSVMSPVFKKYCLKWSIAVKTGVDPGLFLALSRLWSSGRGGAWCLRVVQSLPPSLLVQVLTTGAAVCLCGPGYGPQRGLADACGWTGRD